MGSFKRKAMSEKWETLNVREKLRSIFDRESSREKDDRSNQIGIAHRPKYVLKNLPISMVRRLAGPRKLRQGGQGGGRRPARASPQRAQPASAGRCTSPDSWRGTNAAWCAVHYKSPDFPGSLRSWVYYEVVRGEWMVPRCAPPFLRKQFMYFDFFFQISRGGDLEKFGVVQSRKMNLH